MIMKIMGFDIEVDINKDKTNILVIDDHKLFGSFCYDLNKKDTEKIVFIDNDNRVKNEFEASEDNALKYSNLNFEWIITNDIVSDEFVHELKKVE